MKEDHRINYYESLSLFKLAHLLGINPELGIHTVTIIAYLRLKRLTDKIKLLEKKPAHGNQTEYEG